VLAQMRAKPQPAGATAVADTEDASDR
jgi:hypothetical protein